MSDDLLITTETELLVIGGDQAAETIVLVEQELLVDTVLEVLETETAELLVEQVEFSEVLDAPDVFELLEVALQGPMGPTGPAGIAGVAGVAGSPGVAGIAGAAGAAGPAGPWMPYYIASDETFTIPANQQGLSATDITIDGTMRVDGRFIEIL